MANYLQAEADRIEQNLREENEERRHERGATTSDRQHHNRKRRREKRGFGYWSKRAFRFFIVHVGLISSTVVYSFIGAFLFILLESEEEARDCYDGQGHQTWLVMNLATHLVAYVQNNVTSMMMTNDTTIRNYMDSTDTAYSNIDSWLSSMASDVINLKWTYRYNGQDCESGGQWNVANAILFAVQVITTIGYGNITPVTTEGHVVCICYATIGIPLFLMCLANISGDLGSAFRFLYTKVCCLEMWAKLRKKKINSQNNKMEETEEPESRPRHHRRRRQRPKRVFVPLTLTLLLITTYIVAGATLFTFSEGWEPIRAAYFCFVTLATIGFGDVVPGQSPGDPNKIIKLVSGSVYIFFGMAILAMCFDLIQEDMRAKVVWLGTKLRILDKLEEEEDIDNDEKNKKKASLVNETIKVKRKESQKSVEPQERVKEIQSTTTPPIKVYKHNNNNFLHVRQAYHLNTTALKGREKK